MLLTTYPLISSYTHNRDGILQSYSVSHWIRNWEGARAHLEHFGEEKSLLSLYQDSNFPAWPVRSPVTILTTRGLLNLKTYVGRIQILKIGAWLHVFLFQCKHDLNDVPRFQKQNWCIRHVDNQQVTLLLCCLITTACYHASRIKLFDPLWLMTYYVFSSLTLIVLMWRIGWAHNNARK